jgi:CheY-like chemotaxis protein
VRLGAKPVLVDADPTRLFQAVINLIGNASKYTPEGGRIVVSVKSESGIVVLRVEDNGIGIPPELLPRVFDLFVQGESSLARTEGGLGIGLTLTRRLIELQGGSVAASSGGRGKGSEFIVRLPLAAERDVAQAQVSDAAEAAPASRRRLLVVDDNRDFATMLTALFEIMGHDVRTAYDGPAAISLAADYRPDAVFLDIGLPGMSGYEVARKLRDSPALVRTTLIAFTGYGQDDDRRRVREAGFDHHLVKPADAAQLAKIIDSLPVRA